MQTMQSPSGSEVHLDEWVAPELADEQGHLRAGKILEWMDVVGVLAASRHSRMPVVTASVDGVELNEPIAVGERVTMTARVVHTSPRTIGVSIRMGVGHGGVDGARSVVGAFMTFVALDEQGRPATVPPLHPQTPSEIAGHREGELRREFRKKIESGSLPESIADGARLAEVPASDRAIFARELLKLLPRGIRLPFEKNEPVRARPRHATYAHKIEPVRGGKLNFHGSLYGGTLMRWIDSTAWLSARAHVGRGVRLTHLHGLSFLRPVERDRFVHVQSVVVHASAANLTVLVRVRSEDPIAAQQTETLRAFLTYTPTGAARAAIPRVECTSDAERALYVEVEHRLALARSLESEVMAA